jgi:MoxR-like ATPase
VIATQNPIEYEGTFPLPEAQLDRFLLKLSIGYPTPAEEQEILRRRRARQADAFDLSQVTNGAELLNMRQAVEDIFIDEDIERYIVELVDQTRRDKRVAVGASPRGSLALLKLARAHAALEGRSFVLPDDVKRYARPGLVHRLILEPGLWLKKQAADEIITSIVQNVAVPVVDE